MLRIGNTQGFWGDRPQASADMVRQQPDIDFLTLDYLAELSMSIMAIQREKEPAGGYAKDFLEVLASLVPAWKGGSQVKIVTNAGGLNPVQCARDAAALLSRLQCKKKIAAVFGDDVFGKIASGPATLATANAYLGAQPIVKALTQGAEIVITGRVADVSLTVGPAVYHYNWKWDDYDRLAGASVAGHLIECGTQATGGMTTHWLKMEKKENIGFPFVEMKEDGTFVITKPKGTGGEVTEQTIKEQLLYEIGDPEAFLTPDVTVSFNSLKLYRDGKDRIGVQGAKGRAPTDSYKVSGSYRDGFKCEALLTLFGPQAALKGRLCGQILLDRVAQAGYAIDRFNIECLGALSVVPGVFKEKGDPLEVVLRVSLAAQQKEALEYFAKEVASFVTCGPQGVTGYSAGRPKVRPVFGYWPALIKKSEVKAQVEMIT